MGEKDKDNPAADELLQENAQQRIAFIDTDLDLAMTFVRLADTELGLQNFARVDHLLVKARDAHRTLAKFLAEVVDEVRAQSLRDKHQALADAIANVERKRRHEQ